MPVVDGKKYPYTKEGKAAAKKAKQGYAKGGYISVDPAPKCKPN
jgi:hypothetical protein